MGRHWLAVLVVVTVMMAGCVNGGHSPANRSSDDMSQDRSFLMGIVPTPQNYPNASLEDIEMGYTMAASCCELVNLWLTVPWWETEAKLASPGTQALLTRWIHGNGLTPIYHLNFWSLQQVPGHGLVPRLDIPPGLPDDTTMGDPAFRERWIQQAVNITAAYQPRYISLGNEVDSYYSHAPNRPDFDNYTSLVAETYTAIKQVSPATRVMAVFRLVDIYDKNTFFLIDTLDKNRIDLIGFTTYPYLNASYATPGDLPDSYYTDLLVYTGDIPIAFTEIGWSSSTLTDGTMQEQAAYLDWFINHTAGMPVHMVCWLNLHDMAPAGEETRANELVGLRRNDGMAKPVWERWTAIHDLPYANAPPARPQCPHGETDGTAGTAYTYTATATDPDGDMLLYRFDWDDGTMSSWLGPYPPGERASATHTWNRTGAFGIRVKARDIYGEESEWSDPLGVSMPLSGYTSICSLTAGVPGGLFTMLLNLLFRWIPSSVIPAT
jgi:hypothetical protein